MDEKYKRSYRWRLTAMIMLFLLVLAVIFIAIFALPNDEGQPTTETNKTISGSVNFTGATDNTFYIKEVRLQEGEGEAKVLSITPGYINNGFAFTEIGEVSSDNITLYFDIINATTQPFTISASWTGADDGTIYNLHETTVPAGTGEEIIADTPATATLTLDVTLGATNNLNLFNITIDISQLRIYSDFEFELNDDMTASLTAYKGAGGDVVIPNTFSVVDNGDGTQSYVEGDQYTVTEIYDASHPTLGVFYNRTDITSITLPECLTSIGDWAYVGCGEFTNIIFSTSLISIGEGAFNGCGLTALKLSECTNLKSIEGQAFANCSELTSITLPESLTSIGQGVFLDCSSLTIVDLSGCTNLTSIEGQTFSCCSELTSIILPESLISIGESAFYGCRLAIVDLSGCINLTSVGNGAFSNCTGLTSIVFPETLTNIGNSAFTNCSELTSIVLQSSLNSIGYHAFYNCTNLTSIEFTDPTGWQVSGNSSFSGNIINIDEAQLQDSSTVSELLTSTYVDYYWRKVEA